MAREELAVVVDNKDPFKLGRVRARVDRFHEGVPDDHLPWARSSTGSSGKGTLDVPPIGTEVYLDVTDIQDPTYKGTAIGRETLPDYLKENYPNRRGSQTENGIEEWQDTTTGEVQMKTPAGSEVHHSPDGKLSQRSPLSVLSGVGESVSRLFASGVRAVVPAFRVGGNLRSGTGWTGTYPTHTGKIVTVRNGIITDCS